MLGFSKAKCGRAMMSKIMLSGLVLACVLLNGNYADTDVSIYIFTLFLACLLFLLDLPGMFSFKAIAN